MLGTTMFDLIIFTYKYSLLKPLFSFPLGQVNIKFSYFKSSCI